MSILKARNNVNIEQEVLCLLKESGIDVEVNEETQALILTDALNIKISKYIGDNYKELREQEYPSLTDQLDYLYHNGLDGWIALISSIKAKYPKPI